MSEGWPRRFSSPQTEQGFGMILTCLKDVPNELLLELHRTHVNGNLSLYLKFDRHFTPGAYGACKTCGREFDLTQEQYQPISTTMFEVEQELNRRLKK